MAKLCVWRLGQAELGLSDLTPFGVLTAWLSVSRAACRLYGLCCDGYQHVLFVYKRDRMSGQSKDSSFLSPLQCLLPL